MTYKTNHPTIKEITVGQKFLRFDGVILTFIGIDECEENLIFEFRKNNGYHVYYNKNLMKNKHH